MKRYKHLLLLLALLITGLSVNAANATLSAKLDSATLLMGRVTTVHLELVKDKTQQGFFPIDQLDTLNRAVEIAARPKADTVDLGNGRQQINRDLIIQSFDSGLYVIKPIEYVIGKDTLRSQQLTLKVIPVKVDTMGDIQDFKPVIGIPFRLGDAVPSFISDYWWAWLLGLLLIAGGLYYYLAWYRKGRNPLRPVKRRLPPYDEAMLNLRALKDRQLWQNGMEKEYFTGLTDILRVYLDRRFHVNAVEMTTSQIIDTLKRNEETKAVNEQLSMILEVADFVKFAGVRPLADDNERAMERAMNFVEATRPVETAADEKKEEQP